MSITKNRKAKAGRPKKLPGVEAPLTRVQRVRALRGKFAFVPGSSDDFAKEKAREIEREG